jgi:hypothetical protein
MVQREHEGDVDIDPLADERLDRRNARRGGWHLDQHVGAIQRGIEPPRLGDGARGVVGQRGTDFQADVAIDAAGPVVDRAEDVGCALDVLQGQRLVEPGHRHAGRCQLSQGLVIVGAAGDGLLKDRRVGGHPHHACLDERREPAVVQQPPADVIVPDRLSQFGQFLYPVHLGSPLSPIAMVRGRQLIMICVSVSPIATKPSCS